VLAQVAKPLVRALHRFERDGFAPCVGAYTARDLLLGRVVHTTQPDLPEGVSLGVSGQGALRLRTPQGEREVTSGEVSVRLGPAGEAA
jgi:BirA family biotin operon repressor/biotin-[acetyl-CoA-carboxylase] ligase